MMGFTKIQYALTQAGTALKLAGWGGGEVHNARMMGFKRCLNKLAPMGRGAQTPPPLSLLQTRCSHNGFDKDSYALKRAAPSPFAKGGAQCSHDGFQKRFICFEASLHRYDGFPKDLYANHKP